MGAGAARKEIIFCGRLCKDRHTEEGKDLKLFLGPNRILQFFAEINLLFEAEIRRQHALLFITYQAPAARSHFPL
jgi:hypothetical protein